MPMPQNFSDYLSIIAILFSAVSLYISWRAFQRDDSRLKIKLDFEVTHSVGNAYNVKITNLGRHPASIEKVYARLYNLKRYPVFNSADSLKEMESRTVSVPMSGFHSMHPMGIIAFEVEDAGEKITRTYTWKLWRHIRKTWKPEWDKLS
jgi:hypothetical protein